MGIEKRKKIHVGNVVSIIMFVIGFLALAIVLGSLVLFDGNVVEVWPFGWHIGWHVFGGLLLMFVGGHSLQDE